MNDLADMSAASLALETLVFDRAVLEKMRTCTLGALLSGRADLLALKHGRLRLDDDYDSEEFVLLAALPAAIRREFLLCYEPVAFLTRTRLALANYDNWVAFVETFEITH